MDPEHTDPAPGADDALPEPMLPSAGVPLGVDPEASGRTGRNVPVVRVGRDAARPGTDMVPAGASGPAPPAALRDDDPFGPLPGRVDFGDGLRLTRRSMSLVILVALVPVLAAIGVALILSLGTGQPPTGTSRGQNVSAGGDPADSGAQPAAAGGPGGAATSSGARATSLDDAGDALRAADVGRVGKVEAAWTFRDGSRDVLVAVTRRVTRRNGNFSARAATLTVFEIADPTGKATKLAASDDTGPTCPSGTEVRTSAPATTVKDLDGDGTPEVLVATVHACGSDVRKRVTVLAAGSVYTLSGAGSLVAEPDPPYTDWPNGFLDAATVALDAVR